MPRRTRPPPHQGSLPLEDHEEAPPAPRPAPPALPLKQPVPPELWLPDRKPAPAPVAAAEPPAYPDDDEPLMLDPEQADAVYILAHAPVGIITGGPGRGKTRVLQAALPYLGRDVALCAPTGKAARRMAQLTRYPAQTVHRLLGLKPEGEGRAHHRGNPLPYDVVVVDEASTLDVFLLQKLLDACDPVRTRVFFIGDVDQLPSVGPGQVLLDLIASEAIPVVRLVTMHRSAADSWVCKMAPEILEGRIDLSPAPQFQHIESDTELVEDVVHAVAEVAKRYGRDEVQCIVPMNIGPYGTSAFNAILQEALNPGDGPSFSGGRKVRIRAGDDIVAINNDYDRAVFNGETGRVIHVPPGDGLIDVDFGDRVVQYKRTEAGDNLRLAYALTVHKMQGSEVGYVILVLHESHGPMLSRKLLYTAVTRARHGVAIVGQKSAVMRAVSVSDTTRRVTTLLKRLKQPPPEAVRNAPT